MSRSLPEKVGQLYYSHGVLCAGHPVVVILFTAAVVILSCLPLANLPLPSNIPQIVIESDNITDLPRWYSEQPVYIQQVIMKSAVTPWTKEMQLTDAIRGPLAEVFTLKEIIQNYQHPKSRVSLVDVCAHVEAPSKSSSLPQYNCLLVSPANFWGQDPMQFYNDVSLAATVYAQYGTQLGKAPLSELLFGMGLREAGMKRYPLRNRQRVLQFAVTFAMTKLDLEYLDGLREHLNGHYPLLKENFTSNSVLHLHYLGDFDCHEFLPLFCTYLALFLYMYFSVRKIELVRSKVGMALSAVCTVIASLLMSIGLCFFFGLDPAGSSRGREVFPYLVVVVGLENILVLTKSILSTPGHLDSKIRLAQGLSKEGWGITKNLLTEVTILTIGLFTLVPSIQEFCIFAMVGLLCDFFLQMCFFSTVLSLDMAGSTLDSAVIGEIPQETVRPLPRTRSTPRLEGKVPKRLRLVLFWGRTRIVQRGFMICMVVWIGGFLYSAGIVQHFVQPEGGKKLERSGKLFGKYESILGRESGKVILGSDDKTKNMFPEGGIFRAVGNARPLDPVKWCYLVSAYNASSGPCRLAVLPPIRLCSAVSPTRAISLRNPLEKPTPTFKWDKLALALDPSDESVDYEESSEERGWGAPYLPTSPFEVLLVTAASVVSIIVISYTGIMLYRCVCSRHYADWRTKSWWSRTREQVVLEAVALPLEGKGQIVDAVVTDGNTVSCSYLSGEIDVWDSLSGEPLAHIDRQLYFGNIENSDIENTNLSSSPKNDKTRLSDDWERTIPDLRSLINTNFSSGSYCINQERNSIDSDNAYDYGLAVQRLYDEANALDCENNIEEELFSHCPQIWCLSSSDNIIAAGTSSGRIEFWEATSGQFKCMYDDSNGLGITCIKLTCGRVIVARINGTLEILKIEWENRFGHTPYRRFGGHFRTMSAGGADDLGAPTLKVKLSSVLRVHQQAITVLEVESGRIVSGSHDTTLKVLSLMDELLVFTLHAHYGPITALFIDSVNPMTAGSGSQDGGLCVWDLLTGACVYSLCAHDGRVQALTYSPSYVISLGSDEKLCVWDRFQGHLLNSIVLSQAYCTSMTMLTHNLLVISQQGSLVVRDVRTSEPVRLVRLGHNDCYVSVTSIVRLRSSVACDYGNSLRIVRFPLVRDKAD